MNEVLKPFELDKCPGSRLPEEIQLFMKAIVSVCSYGNAFRSCLPLPLPPLSFFWSSGVTHGKRPYSYDWLMVTFGCNP